MKSMTASLMIIRHSDRIVSFSVDFQNTGLEAIYCVVGKFGKLTLQAFSERKFDKLIDQLIGY